MNLTSLKKRSPNIAGITYLEVSKIPKKRGFVLPKYGARKYTKDASLVPTPAKEIGSKPIKVDIIRIKGPDKLHKDKPIELAKSNI